MLVFCLFLFLRGGEQSSQDLGLGQADREEEGRARREGLVECACCVVDMELAVVVGGVIGLDPCRPKPLCGKSETAGVVPLDHFLRGSVNHA